ncbi:hypothetical protein Tco_1546344 [Tanacetum coccineum]
MSNSNTNLQTQSSNALHNAIMEAGSKDRPPMLAPGNYVQWKSRIKRDRITISNPQLNLVRMHVKCWKAIERFETRSMPVLYFNYKPEWQRSQQSTRNRGKAIVTSSAPTYDPEPATGTKMINSKGKGD